MNKNSTIRSFTAALMLLVFAFAVTPKRFLHNLVVNHKDTFNKLTNGKTEISKNALYCQCDDLVATSPFTHTLDKPEIKPAAVFCSHQEYVLLPNLFPAHIYFSLRGPPAFVSI